MQWLLQGSLAAAGEALRRCGDSTHTAAEADLNPDAPPQEVLLAAGRRQWNILTDDATLARAPYQGPTGFGRCIVLVLSADHGDAIERLFARFKRLSPGRLYTVTNSGVKVRQLPLAQEKH
jgi:hypothetical protein